MDPCPIDVLDLLAACNLENRIALFQKNLSAAFSSGVVVAEIIHAFYPKLIQVIILSSYFVTVVNLFNL